MVNYRYENSGNQSKQIQNIASVVIFLTAPAVLRFLFNFLFLLGFHWSCHSEW